MKSREILLVVLVVAIALGSGLIGLYLGRSSVQQAAGPAAESAVTGVSVAASKIRLWDNAQKTGDVAFEIVGNRIYQGPESSGQAILYFDGTTFFRGANNSGEKLYVVDNSGRIHAGANTSGPTLYTIQSNRVYEGDNTSGDALYTISGDQMHEGPNTSGNVVFKANQQLTGDVQFALPILADTRF